MANSLRAQIPKRGAASRAPLPPKNPVVRNPIGESTQQPAVEEERITPVEQIADEQTPETVIDLRDNASTETDAPQMSQPVDNAPAKTPAPKKPKEVAPAPTEKQLAIPCQLQLDPAVDQFLTDVEMEGMRMRKRVANRSSAARFALAIVMQQMSAQELAKAIADSASSGPRKPGRPRV